MSRARTIQIIRHLRALGPLRARRRIPPQAQPDAIRLEYYKALVPFCEATRELVDEGEMVRLLVGLRRSQGHMDASDGKGRALELVRGARERFEKRWGSALAGGGLRNDAARVAEKFGKRTTDFQREQLDRQVRAAVGVPLGALEKPARDKIPGFVASNVDLIKTVSDRYFDALQQDVHDAFESGIHPETFAEQLADDYEVSLSNARRIARDQIGKLSAEVNQSRQEALGVEGYYWRGALDNRERDNHRELEGKFFRWDDPPMGGGTSDTEPGHPGTGILCRCWSEPDFSPLTGSDED